MDVKNDTGRELSPWDIDSTVELPTLQEILRAAVQRPTRIDDDDRSQIAIRFTPPGFRAVMGQLAHEHRISYSNLTRLALDVGITILDAHPSIIGVRGAYNLTRADAMSSGDQDALVRLNQPVSYEFQRSQVDRTTLTVSRETSARLTELAMVCGIPTGKLAVEAILLALLTLRNNRGYRGGLITEVRAFHKFVLRRRRVLLIGDDGSGPSVSPRALR